jgi:transcriptional regulator with XRE-family HTH domain
VKPQPKRTYPNLRAFLEHLDEQGTTQAEFAAQMKISEAHLSELKNGRTVPSLSLARRLSQECGVPIESFLTSHVS